MTRALFRKIRSRLAGIAVFPAALVFYAATAFAAGTGGGTSAELCPLMVMFLIFFGVIVLLQLIPAMILFACFIACVFRRSERATGTRPEGGSG